MARTTYSSAELGKEVVAPSGYYQPLEEACVEYEGRRVLYTLGTVCIEASCCGKGSWDYARVEGYVIEEPPSTGGPDPRARGDEPKEVDTVEDAGEKTAITKLLQEKHPGVRVEFR